MASKKPIQEESTFEQVDIGFLGSKEETAESRTVASRQRLRNQMNRDVEEFLKRGGAINQIDANVTADPPQKPTSNYGSRPI